MWKTAVLIGYLVILSIYDIRFKKIPYSWLLLGGSLAVVNIAVLHMAEGGSVFFPRSSVFLCYMPGLVMLAAGKLTGKVGYGDGIVLLMIGCILDGGQMAAAFAASLLLSAAAAAFMLLFCRAGREDKLPFLPFLAIAVIFTQL